MRLHGQLRRRCGCVSPSVRPGRDALADQVLYLDFAKRLIDSVVSRVRLPILIASSLPVLSKV